jgi:hypothetical protein
MKHGRRESGLSVAVEEAVGAAGEDFGDIETRREQAGIYSGTFATV